MAGSISHVKYQDKFTIATYQDGRKWVAHNLGLDVIGVGNSKKSALKELEKLTMSQIQFAIQHHLLDSINHPAPERFWKMVSEKINANFVGQLVRQSGVGMQENLRQFLRNASVYDLGSKSRLA